MNEDGRERYGETGTAVNEKLSDAYLLGIAMQYLEALLCESSYCGNHKGSTSTRNAGIFLAEMQQRTLADLEKRLGKRWMRRVRARTLKTRRVR